MWRFDPLILTDKISIDNLIAKISNIADKLNDYTEKLVFSFADIASYKKVGRNLANAGVKYSEWDESSMRKFAQKLSKHNSEHWNFELATCAETIDLSEYGIEHNRCIDPDLIAQLSPDDPVLKSFLWDIRPDKGQRKACGCVLSKDIGAYNTCPHSCIYCYANTTPQSALFNYKRHNVSPIADSII